MVVFGWRPHSNTTHSPRRPGLSNLVSPQTCRCHVTLLRLGSFDLSSATTHFLSPTSHQLSPADNAPKGALDLQRINSSLFLLPSSLQAAECWWKLLCLQCHVQYTTVGLAQGLLGSLAASNMASHGATW